MQQRSMALAEAPMREALEEAGAAMAELARAGLRQALPPPSLRREEILETPELPMQAHPRPPALSRHR